MIKDEDADMRKKLEDLTDIITAMRAEIMQLRAASGQEVEKEHPRGPDPMQEGEDPWTEARDAKSQVNAVRTRVMAPASTEREAGASRSSGGDGGGDGNGGRGTEEASNGGSDEEPDDGHRYPSRPLPPGWGNSGGGGGGGGGPGGQATANLSPIRTIATTAAAGELRAEFQRRRTELDC